MTAPRSWSAAIVAALAFVFLPTLTREGQRAAVPPGPYTVTDLGTFGGIQSAQAHDINDAGQAVGYAAGKAFVWQGGVLTDLGTLGGNSGLGAAINGVGQIVGRSTTSSGALRATLWDHGVKTDLTPNISPGDSSAASGINDARQVVLTLNYGVPFLWENGALTNLGHLGGGGAGSASDINNAGQVVGSSLTNIATQLGPMPHAFLWQNGVMDDLGVLPGANDDESGAAAINTLGQIVGSSGHTDPDTYEITSRSFLYENGDMIALPVPSQESYAGDINDSGVVVGTMRAGGGPTPWNAYIYADGVVTNLNSLLVAGSGLHLAWASGISNEGQIVGTAYDAQAHLHAFLLTPVDASTSVVNIGNSSVTEGHAGTQSANLTVTLSPASSQPVTVSYSTANGTAAAGSDYQAASGTVTFDAGQTSKTISVLVKGDRAGEPNETFFVNLSQATGGAAIADAQGVGTIVDDEPRISIGHASGNEGDNGTTQFVFTVSLSAPSDIGVSVNYATSNGSARAPDDYTAKSGSLSFAAGQTSKTVAVNVKGDRRSEGQEQFYVNLSGDAGAFVALTPGVGNILNDD